MLYMTCMNAFLMTFLSYYMKYKYVYGTIVASKLVYLVYVGVWESMSTLDKNDCEGV